MPPLTARAHDIEQTVQQTTHVCPTWPTTGLGRRNKRFERPILLVAQGLVGAEVSDQRSIHERPHGGLQPGAPGTPSHDHFSAVKLIWDGAPVGV